MPNSSIFDEFEKSWFLAIWSHHTTSIYWAETSFLANFAKFFGHQYTKSSLIFLKIKSCLVLVSRNNNLNLQIDWLANLDFIERKPQFRPFSLSFLATGRPKMAQFSWEINQVWPLPLETIIQSYNLIGWGALISLVGALQWLFIALFSSWCDTAQSCDPWRNSAYAILSHKKHMRGLQNVAVRSTWEAMCKEAFLLEVDIKDGSICNVCISKIHNVSIRTAFEIMCFVQQISVTVPIKFWFCT